MPRGGFRRKPRIYRDMCEVLDVVELAEAGAFAPGRRVIECELLGITAHVGAEIGGSEGVLCPDWPVSQRVPAVCVATAIGPRWLLVCRACGRRVRRLYVPDEVEVAPWSCRHCSGPVVPAGAVGRCGRTARRN